MWYCGNGGQSFPYLISLSFLAPLTPYDALPVPFSPVDTRTVLCILVEVSPLLSVVLELLVVRDSMCAYDGFPISRRELVSSLKSAVHCNITARKSQ
jgi:hypothetical protein